MKKLVRDRRTGTVMLIEDQSQLTKLIRLAKKASRRAIFRAKLHERAITYLEDGWIIRETPKGEKIKIKKLESTPNQKRPAGARFQLS